MFTVSCLQGIERLFSIALVQGLSRINQHIDAILFQDQVKKHVAIMPNIFRLKAVDCHPMLVSHLQISPVLLSDNDTAPLGVMSLKSSQLLTCRHPLHAGSSPYQSPLCEASCSWFAPHQRCQCIPGYSLVFSFQFRVLPTLNITICKHNGAIFTPTTVRSPMAGNTKIVKGPTTGIAIAIFSQSCSHLFI